MLNKEATLFSKHAGTNSFIVPEFRGTASSEAGYWERFTVAFGTPGNLADQVTPPYLTTRKWSENWTASLAPNQWGFVAPRYDGRAVTAMMDGHVQTMDQAGLQDMRHWANTADRPDFILKPAP